MRTFSKTLFAVLVALSLALASGACGKDDGGKGKAGSAAKSPKKGPYACELTKDKKCHEITGKKLADSEGECKSNKGKHSTGKCPTDNKIATCDMTLGPETWHVVYYKGFEGDLDSDCKGYPGGKLTK